MQHRHVISAASESLRRVGRRINSGTPQPDPAPLLGGGWRAPQPNPAHDVAHQCPPGASLAAPPVGFDMAAAKAEEAERFCAIAKMSQQEAEAACEALGVVVWKPQSGRPVPLERLQQHLRDHFAAEQAKRGGRVVASDPVAAAAAAADAQRQANQRPR